MLVKIQSKEWYVPKWEGNDKLPEGEQIRVLISDPSGARSAAAATSASKYGDSFVHVYDFCTYCEKVEGLTLETEEGIRDAKPEDIAIQDGLYELYLDIKTHFLEKYRKDKKK